MKQLFFSLFRFIRMYFILLLALVFVGCMGNTYASKSSATAQRNLDTPTVARITFQGLVGPWVSHAAGLTFYADGSADYKERVYSWCGPGVPQPCDSFQGNMIISGDIEHMQFTRMNNGVAYGTVTASTVGHKGFSVTLTRQANDTVVLSEGTPTITRVLCGPDAPVGTCGA